MTNKLIRRVWFTRAPMSGWYRYGDVFQLTPAPPPINPTGVIMYDYPTIVDINHDPRIWTERSPEDDFWFRDVWERNRDVHLQKQSGSVEQAETYQELSRQNRLSAIDTEIQVLLTILTNSTFSDYRGNTNSWFIVLSDSGISDPVWGQPLYPLAELEIAKESFSSTSEEQVKTTSSENYYGRTRNVIAEEIEFPSFLDDLFTRYFSLDPKRKHAFYRACLLWVQANDRRMPPSMSLVAEVSAIETLVHWGDPDPERCDKCNTFLGPDTCDACGNTKHGLTRRFREFMMPYAGTSTKKLANRMYDLRSLVSHQGDLLRDDLFDSGFNTGDDDKQFFLQMNASKATRLAIVRWFIAQE